MDGSIKASERRDLAEMLLRDVDARLRSQHHSVGNAVASIKELTLCLIAAWYKRAEKAEGIPEQEFPIDGLTRMALGTAWGDYLNPRAERRLELDTPSGIISGRVDLDIETEGPNGPHIVPVELKLTNYSAKKSLSEMAQYVEQLGAYVLGTPEALGDGMIGTLHLGMPQTFRLFTLHFAPDELQAFESELFRRVEAVLNPKVRPSLADHYQWECRYCKYSLKNGGPCPGTGGKTQGFFSIEMEEV